MKIAFLCHYFHPEIGAPSARVYEMACEWVREGHLVKVVTCFPNHPTGKIPEEYRGKRFQKENIEGIEVFRNYVFATPNKGFIKKILSHLSFMASSVLFSLPRIGEVDVVVVSSPTLFSVISAFIYSRVKKVPYVFEVRDLWPAVFVDLKVITNRFIISVLEKLEMFLYHQAAHIVVVTLAFKENLESRGISSEKVEVITNGADVDFFYPREEGHALRTELGLEGKFVVLYIGAHGISHALHSIVGAAERLEDDEEVHFLFVGEGAEKEKVVHLAQEKNLSNVSFLGGQPKEMVPLFYAISDICLVPLRDVELFKGFIPSKIFEIMASCRPIIASVAGETADILRTSGAAKIISPEDPVALADAVRELKVQPELRAEMGTAGRRFVMAHYSRKALSQRYIALLKRLI
jgi:glycosyltransferase involved in cell wall biosynthesis